MSSSVTVFVDAMGGDFAPRANVKAAIAATQEKQNLEIVLVGKKDSIEAFLPQASEQTLDRIRIEHCEDSIAMGEHPSTAVRKKKDASINVAMRAAANTENSAFLSAGNSGAALASAVLYMKRIHGVERPAIAASLPTTKGILLLVDAGANTQCRASQLVQFALLGSTYYKHLVPNSIGSIGVLSNGGEETKGTDLTRLTNEILQSIQKSGIIPDNTYRGYVEGASLFFGSVNVAVCDGFTGNLMLKGLEGLASAMTEIIRNEVRQDWLAAIGLFFARRALKRVQKKVDYAEIGGAPLIGVKGHAFIAHGKSNTRAMKNAILHAANAAESDLSRDFEAIIQESADIM